MAKSRTGAPDDGGKVGWRIPEWSAATGIGRSSIYELIDDELIALVKHGRSRIILTPPRDYLRSLADAHE
jgi:hypothetical protein